MTQNQKLSADPIKPVLLGKRMLLGSVPALLLISFFLWSAGKGNPAWGDYWMIRPLVITPFAGAIGGAVYAFLDGLRIQLRWNRTFIVILSFVIYFIGLWLGFVLGLAGTYWN